MEQLTGLKKMRFKLQHYDTEKQKDKRLYLPFCFSIKFSENNKSEPIAYRHKVRIYSLWWGLRDSNPGPVGYEPNALTN